MILVFLNPQNDKNLGLKSMPKFLKGLWIVGNLDDTSAEPAEKRIASQGGSEVWLELWIYCVPADFSFDLW